MVAGATIAQLPSWRAASAATVIPDPISFYAFDETSGSATAADRIRGAAGLATLVGNPSFSSGRVGNALCLNGSSQYGTAAVVSGVTSEFTISAWVKLNSFSQWATIVKNWGNASTGTFHFGLNGSDNKWSNYIGLLPNTAVSIVDPNVTTTGEWHQVVTTASQSLNQLRLYVDNTKVAESTFSGTIKSFGTLMSFGAKLDDNQTSIAPVNPGWLNGCLDEVAFWDVALSPTQLTDIYSSGLNGTSPIAPTTTTTTTTVPATTTPASVSAPAEPTSTTTSLAIASGTSAPEPAVDESAGRPDRLPSTGSSLLVAWSGWSLFGLGLLVFIHARRPSRTLVPRPTHTQRDT